MVKVPDPMLKREWIYGIKASDDELRALGYVYLEQERYNDACDCFLRVKENEGLAQLKKIAIDIGDFFLARKLRAALEFSPKEWSNLAKNAENKGKILFAMAAFEEGGEQGKTAELKAKILEENKGKCMERLLM